MSVSVCLCLCLSICLSELAVSVCLTWLDVIVCLCWLHVCVCLVCMCVCACVCVCVCLSVSLMAICPVTCYHNINILKVSLTPLMIRWTVFDSMWSIRTLANLALVNSDLSLFGP